MHRNLTNGVKTILLDPGDAAGTTKITETSFDTYGFDSYRIVVGVGTVTAGGQVVLSSNSSPDNSTWSTITGSGNGGALKSTTTNSLIIGDVHRPPQRYIQPIVDRSGGTANVVILFVLVELFQSSHEPITQDPTVAASLLLSNPGSGGAI